MLNCPAVCFSLEAAPLEVKRLLDYIQAAQDMSDMSLNLYELSFFSRNTGCFLTQWPLGFHDSGWELDHWHEGPWDKEVDMGEAEYELSKWVWHPKEEDMEHFSRFGWNARIPHVEVGSENVMWHAHGHIHDILADHPAREYYSRSVNRHYLELLRCTHHG